MVCFGMLYGVHFNHLALVGGCSRVFRWFSSYLRLSENGRTNEKTENSKFISISAGKDWVFPESNHFYF